VLHVIEAATQTVVECGHDTYRPTASLAGGELGHRPFGGIRGNKLAATKLTLGIAICRNPSTYPPAANLADGDQVEPVQSTPLRL
jgi:hypothetical protein